MTNHKENLAMNERDEGNDVLTDSDSPPRSRNRPLYGQIMVALVGYGTTLSIGFTAGFSGVLLHQLQSNSSDFQVDDNMASWIVSIYTGATSIGCFLSGFIMNFTGRRITVLMGIYFLTIGWIFIALSIFHAIMLLGRAIDGFGRGNIVLSITIHQDEMADPRLRITLNTCCLLTFSIGVVITALWTTLDWRITAGISGALSFVIFVAYYFVPESPVWLVRNGKSKKPEKSSNGFGIIEMTRRIRDNMKIDPMENLALNDSNDEIISNDSRSNRSRNRPLYGQVLVALMAHGATFCVGLTGGFSGILLHQLRNNTSELQIDDNIASWIVSIYTGATSMGCLFSGIIMFYAGRCKTVLVGDLSLTLGWILISLSNSVPLMLIGRALDGFGRGTIVLAAVIHQDEMADPRLRASLISCCLLTYSVGVAVITAIGTKVGWRISAAIGAGFSLLDMIGYCFLPESPVWLARNGKTQKAREVFKWLWNHQHDEKAEEDLQELQNRLHEEETQGHQISWKLKLKECFKTQYMKPFFIIHTFNLILIFCGIYIVIYYSSDILSELNKTGDLDLNFMLIFTSVVRVVAMILTCFLLLWYGRRPLCIFSGAVAGLATLGIAMATSLHFFHSWLLFMLLLIYVAFSTCGLFTVLPLLTTEMMPSRIRSVACGYIYTMDDIGLFIFTKAFPLIVRDIGIHGLFWILSCSCFILSSFLYLFLPETKDHTLVDIEKYFSQKNILWIKRQGTQNRILQYESGKC